MTKTLEMLSEPSVQRISVSSEMEEWWRNEVSKVNSTAEKMKSGEKDVTERGDSEKDEAQWGHTLPGHGGT
jgi:hypothetical protein